MLILQNYTFLIQLVTLIGYFLLLFVPFLSPDTTYSVDTEMHAGFISFAKLAQMPLVDVFPVDTCFEKLGQFHKRLTEPNKSNDRTRVRNKH